MHASTRRLILRLLTRRRRLAARFLATSAGESALTMAGIFLVERFLSGVLGGGEAIGGGLLSPRTALWVTAGLLLGTSVGAALLRYANEVAQQHLVKVVELGFMEQLIQRMLAFSVPFVERQSHGDILQAVRSDVAAVREVALSYARLFLDGVVVLGLLFAAVRLSPLLTVASLIVLPAGVLPLRAIGRATRERSFAVRRTRYALFDAVLEILRGIRVTKVYHGEAVASRNAVRRGASHFDALIDQVRVHALARVTLRSLSGLSLVIVVVLGGFQVLSGALGWPALFAFLMAVRALGTPLASVNNAYVEIKRHGASLERLHELMAEAPDVVDRADARALVGAPERIEVDDVRFGFDDAPVIDGISFTARRGEVIGIAGPSGSGKTTLLGLLARFYDPWSGSVRLDGRDLREYRLDDVYRSVALVTQEPFLFSASVFENIACGRPDATPEEVVAAARDAEIHDEILELEDGYETQVGSGGRALSVGQAQRVTVARALLKAAPILLLDEATASLDAMSEDRVRRAVRRAMDGRTTFIVAHRLANLVEADRILVVERGRLEASGTHARLLEDSAVYRALWETQNGGVPAS